MNEHLQVINYETNQIRATEINGELVACAKDIALALGYERPNDAVNAHCKGAVIRRPLETAGGTQEARFIKEPDIFRLIMRAKTEPAEKFQDFVFEELLPQYRKQGFYMGHTATMQSREVASLEFRAQAARARMEAEAWELKARQVFEIEGAVAITDWLSSIHPELNAKQVANLSRTIKQVIAMELGQPVTSMHFLRRGKRLCAHPAAIEEAFALIETRKELN